MTAWGVIIGSSGCLGDGEDELPQPVALTDGQTCAVCGMEIAAHFGPAVQAHYEDGFAAFDSISEFLSYDADRRRLGTDRVIGYATDYTRVSYSLDEREEGAYISTHAETDDFAPVTELSYLVDSGVYGAMGPDAVPFGDADDAAVLAGEYGGSVVGWGGLREAHGLA